MQIDVDTNPYLASRMYNNDVDGKIFMKINAEDSINIIGMTYGAAQSFVSRREEYFGSYGWPPSDVFDTAGKRAVNEQFDVSVTFIVERLLDLKEPDFTFEIEMWLIVTWEDEKIFAKCEQAGVGGVFDDGDPCALFWQPEFVWDNLVLIDHPEATLVPNTVQNFGLTTRVAENKTGVVEGVGSPGLKTSFGMLMFRVRGTFQAELNFRSFPYDSQELNVTIQMASDLPLRKVKLNARADPLPSKDGGGDLPLWETVCITTATGVDDKTAMASSFMAAEDDPYSVYISNTMLMSPEIISREVRKSARYFRKAMLTFDSLRSPQFFAHNDMKTNGMDEGASMVDEYQQWSTATLTIVVKRLPNFYLYNFVVVVVLLVIVSFFSFRISKSSLDGRLGLTLTVVLGLNVFQIVIIDNMPATGYLTR